MYWRQRNSLRWIKLGDENTSFFHTIATITHKRDFIVSLINQDGYSIRDHDQKANLLLSAFRDKLGKSEFTSMAYDLSSILSVQDLDGLNSDFT